MARKHQIEPGTLVRQVPGMVAVEMGSHLVMLSVAEGAYFALDEVAARIWPLLVEPRSVREILSLLLDEYDVDPRRLEDDVLSFVREMATRGLVEVVGESPR